MNMWTIISFSVDPLPIQVAVVSRGAPGAASGGAASGGAEPGGVGSEGAGSWGAEPEGVEPGGAESEGAEPEGAETEGAESGGAEPRGAEPRGAASSGGPTGASPRLSSQQLREWLVQRTHRRSVAPGAGEPGGAGAGGAGAGVAGVGGHGAGGAGAAGAGAVDPGARGIGGTVRPRPYFVPLLQQVFGVPSSPGLPPPFLCPPPDQSQPPLQPASPLPVPSPYTEQSGGLTERREPASRPVSPVRTAHRAPRSRPPPVPGTHTMALRPSSVPLRVPLPAPPDSSVPEVPDPESDRARAASATVARLLATAVTDPSFESAAAFALVAELLDFAAACRFDYASALVVESVPSSPPSVRGECALGTDVLEDRREDFECLAAAVPCFASLLLAPEGDPDAPDIPTPRSYAEAIEGPYSSQWQAAMDAEMASWNSTGTYVDEVLPPGVNIVDGMWIFRGVDYFQTFSPTPKMTTLRVLLHVAAQRDYELHSLDFSTAFLQGSLHEEIWLRRPPGFTVSFPTGTQWSLRRPVYGLRQMPREWHDTLRTTLAALGFVPSTADPSLFLRTDTSLPPFYALVYVDDLVFATADTEALTLVKSFSASASSSPRHSSLLCLPATRSQLHLRTSPTSGMGLVLGGRGPVVLTGHADASRVDDSATQRSSQGYTFSLGFGSVSWRSTRSSSVLSSSCEAEIYAGAMASQELRWLTYMLTDLGEQPRSPPVLYVDNKAMIALCQEHRLEHRTKHIALRYFLARELQQRGQLRLAYVATRANTADVFTKALPPGDHQRFVTVLGLLALLFLTGLGPPQSTAPLVASPCPACRVALLAVASPCPARRVALPCQSRRPTGRHVALLLARGIAACASPCPARAELPCCPHRPAARRPAARAARAALLLPTLLGSALLADALLPATPCCAPPCWPVPCCPHSPAARRPAAACPAARSPAGWHPAARDRPAGSRTAARTALPMPPCCCPPCLLARRSALPAMASLSVLTFDHKGRPIQFDTWLDDLHLYLLSDSRDSVSLFDHTSGASLAPPTTADSATRSQWLTRDAATRLAVRNYLPLAERTHFGQHKTAKALYDAGVARYSTHATAALGRLILPYLFPELSAFATVEDLVTHLRTSDARYRAALPAEDHFLALDPTDLIVDLLKKHLFAAETSVVAVGAACGTPRTPFFEGYSPSPLAPSYASAAAVDILGTEDVGTTSVLSGKRRSSKGKGGKSGGGGSGGGGGGGSGGGGGGVRIQNDALGERGRVQVECREKYCTP
ncbi:unnamed protein product [Closterium sp. NIES-53]